MIARRTLFAAVVLLIVGTFPALHLMWRAQPTYQLDLLVFDVSVADDRFAEHAVLDRILTNERIEFELGSDHVGAKPGGLPFGDWPSEQPDLIVLADGDGVYVNEEYRIDDAGRTLISPTLQTPMAAEIERWIANGVPAYAEFALTTDPTPVDASEYIQDAFGFDSSGWIGRSEEDLAQVSPLIRELSTEAWSHEGPGIVFVTTRAGAANPSSQVVVLDETHLTSLLPTFDGTLDGGRGNHAPFSGWFELVEPTTGDIQSWLEIPTNDQGAEVLRAAGLPTRWPGVITTPTTIYVAADGLQDETGFAFRSFAGGEWMSAQFSDTPEEQFFHQILRPAISQLVADAVDLQDRSSELMLE